MYFRLFLMPMMGIWAWPVVSPAKSTYCSTQPLCSFTTSEREGWERGEKGVTEWKRGERGEREVREDRGGSERSERWESSDWGVREGWKRGERGVKGLRSERGVIEACWMVLSCKTYITQCYEHSWCSRWRNESATFTGTTLCPSLSLFIILDAPNWGSRACPSGKIHSVIVKWLTMSPQRLIVYISEVCLSSDWEDSQRGMRKRRENTNVNIQTTQQCPPLRCSQAPPDEVHLKEAKIN